MVPRSASSAVRAPPPTGTEVLEGGLRDSSIGEGEEVPRSPWGWPNGVDFGPANFGLPLGLFCVTGAAKLTNINPWGDGPCIDPSVPTGPGAQR